MKAKHLLIGIPLLLLVSCGQDVAQALGQTIYHTQDFASNMYQDSVLATTLTPSAIDDSVTHAVAADDVIIGVANLKGNDGLYQGTPINDEQFATTNKLSRTLPEVKYGFESKLFDGILHCSDAIRTSKSRLQIMESGFGYVFPKTIESAPYAGVYLKAGADTYSGGVFITDVRVSLSFYVQQTANTFEKHAFSMDISGIRRSDFPEFYGFYFEDAAPELSLEGATAISVTYEILDAAAQASEPELTALFVYELVLPRSVWH